jgi:hypothetical protein
LDHFRVVRGAAGAAMKPVTTVRDARNQIQAARSQLAVPDDGVE